MNLKKKIRDFMTLTRHGNGGFTLVELIVVIAILAILGAVAIPAYSGYITKANKQADQSLVSDVAQALVLQYYMESDPVADYVILSTTGAKAEEGGMAEAAMEATFGANWRETLVLKYNGWTDDGILNELLKAYEENPEEIKKVINSSYVQLSTPSELMESVTLLSDSLSGLAGDAKQDPLTTVKLLLNDDDAEKLKQEIKEKYNLEWKDGVNANNSEYTTVAANMLVKYVMDEMAGTTLDENGIPVGLSTMSELAYTYALAYGWGAASETGAAELEKLNAAIANAGNSTDVQTVLNDFFTSQPMGGEFYKHSFEDSTDNNAIFTIMKTASNIVGDNLDMTQAGLFSSSEVADKLDNYVGAVTAIGSMSDKQIAALKNVDIQDGEIVVFVLMDGKPISAPAAAYPAN